MLDELSAPGEEIRLLVAIGFLDLQYLVHELLVVYLGDVVIQVRRVFEAGFDSLLVQLHQRPVSDFGSRRDERIAETVDEAVDVAPFGDAIGHPRIA